MERFGTRTRPRPDPDAFPGDLGAPGAAPPDAPLAERLHPRRFRSRDERPLDADARRRHRIITDIAKLAAYILVGLIAMRFPLLHAMLVGYLVADAVTWFVQILADFASGIFVGLTEAIVYVLLLAWLGAPTTGLAGDTLLCALAAGVFVLTIIVKVSAWLER